MRGLMLRIFFWFWLTLALMGSTLLLTWMIAERGPLINRVRAVLKPVLTIQGPAAVEIYEREGQSGLASYLADIEHSTGMRAYLLDDKDEEISKRLTGPELLEVQALARKAAQSGQAEYRLGFRETWVASPFCSEENHCYRFAAWFPGEGGSALRTDGLFLLLRLASMLLIGAAVCYWLARYLTAPILQLRHATQRISAGDLSARVSPRLAMRADEVAGLAQDFNGMADRIAALLESQRRLLGDISHELRSPLTRLNISLELARQAAGGAAREEHDRIERESDRLNELIGQLLTLARIENDAGAAEFSEIDLAEIIREIAADADFEAHSRNCRVRTEIQAEGVVWGAPPLLRSAIENIVRNAVHYTKTGTEVVITLQKTQTQKGEQLVVRVDDQGSGVPDEALAHLFRPFYRVSDARDRQSGGTGLGLAIAERAVNLFGGRVTAANLAKGGLSVQVVLPPPAQ